MLLRSDVEDDSEVSLELFRKQSRRRRVEV